MGILFPIKGKKKNQDFHLPGNSKNYPILMPFSPLFCRFRFHWLTLSLSQSMYTYISLSVEPEFDYQLNHGRIQCRHSVSILLTTNCSIPRRNLVYKHWQPLRISPPPLRPTIKVSLSLHIFYVWGQSVWLDIFIDHCYFKLELSILD